MKLKQLIPLVAILGSSVSLNAQPKVLNVISANAEVSATNKVVAKANETVNSTLDNLLSGNIFKKKNRNAAKTDTVATVKEQPAAGSSNTTELTIPNIDYSSIVALANIIKSNKNVTDVQRSFSNGLGIINVTHSCKTEELLDDILKNASGKYDVAEVTKGKITLRAKN